MVNGELSLCFGTENNIDSEMVKVERFVMMLMRCKIEVLLINGSKSLEVC
jgi:hypothetical protein